MRLAIFIIKIYPAKIFSRGFREIRTQYAVPNLQRWLNYPNQNQDVKMENRMHALAKSFVGCGHKT